MADGCYMAIHCRSSSVTMVDARVVVVEVDEVMASVVVVVAVVVVAVVANLERTLPVPHIHLL